MGLSTKDPEVVKLAGELSTLLGVCKTEAIRQALEEKKQRLSSRFSQTDRPGRLKNLLEKEI